MNKYIQFEPHSSWSQHYVEGHYNNWLLAFTREFQNKYLPSAWTRENSQDDFSVELIDTEDNDRVYWGKMPAHYEDGPGYYELGVEYYTIMLYPYEEHFCACHRKQMAAEAGVTGLNDDCEGDRFRIRSITYEKLPDVILYSETLGREKLEHLIGE